MAAATVSSRTPEVGAEGKRHSQRYVYPGKATPPCHPCPGMMEGPRDVPSPAVRGACLPILTLGEQMGARKDSWSERGGAQEFQRGEPGLHQQEESSPYFHRCPQKEGPRRPCHLLQVLGKA